MRSVCAILLLLAIMFFGAVVTAAEHEKHIAVITNLDKPFDLAPYIEFIEDPDRSMTWEALDPDLLKWSMTAGCSELNKPLDVPELHPVIKEDLNTNTRTQ